MYLPWNHEYKIDFRVINWYRLQEDQDTDLDGSKDEQQTSHAVLQIQRMYGHPVRNISIP
jgi:hypothetical protein